METTGRKNSDIKTLSFEQALNELEKIIVELESGEADLEKAMDYYARADLLKKHCQSKLEKAKLQVEKIVASEGGNASVEDFTESG